MTRTRSTCHYAPLLAALLFGSFSTHSASAQQQFASAGSFANPAAALPSASLPEAPSAAGVVNAMPAPVEQPLILPRNWRIAPGANGTSVPAKVGYYLGSTWSIRNLLEALAVAGVPNLTSPPVMPIAPTGDNPIAAQNYQNAMDTYGDEIDTWLQVNEKMLRYRAERFEVGFATAETRELISNLALPLALHQQARYLPAPVNSDMSERMWNAASSIVVTRNDAGFLVPNYSKLGGTVAAAFLGKALFAKEFKAPELDSDHFVARYIGYSLLGDLATNTAHELVRAALEPDLTMFNLHGRASDDSYYPLSIGGKLVYWGRSTYELRNFATAALVADLPHIVDRPVEPEEGQSSTWNGYANYDLAYDNFGTDLLGWKQSLEDDIRYHERRLVGGLGESETQMFLANFAIPVAFDMDPRYVPLGEGYSGGERMAHAFRGLFITHTDAGNQTINLPVLGGTVGAAFAAKEIYYPELGTPALESGSVLATTIGLNFAADALGNIVGEFLRRRTY